MSGYIHPEGHRFILSAKAVGRDYDKLVVCEVRDWAMNFYGRCKASPNTWHTGNDPLDYYILEWVGMIDDKDTMEIREIHKGKGITLVFTEEELSNLRII
jgi:hypothetical protein